MSLSDEQKRDAFALVEGLIVIVSKCLDTVTNNMQSIYIQNARAELDPCDRFDGASDLRYWIKKENELLDMENEAQDLLTSLSISIGDLTSLCESYEKNPSYLQIDKQITAIRTFADSIRSA